MRISFPTLVLAISTSLLPFTASAEDILKPGDLVAICGDSITEQRQYSVFMQEYLVMCQPAPNLCAMQFGWSGEKAGGFAARIENDVLPFKPNVATLCYGMNDGGYVPINDTIAQTYRAAITDSVAKLKKGGVRAIVVGTPGVVDPASYKNPKSTPQEYNDSLKALGAVAKEVAAAEGVAFADVHSAMMEGMTAAKAKLGDSYKIAGDGVHPSANGQLLMAYAFLKGLGCNGEIGSIQWDAASGKAVADSAQKVLSADKSTIELESTRYPYCFFGKTDDSSARAMSQFIPFNQDLNRYLLIVKNAPKKARVTWGNNSKEYTSEELAKGINLAADFVENPFSPAFQAVSKLIKDQQGLEVKNIKGNLHSLLNWDAAFPGEKATTDRLRELVVTKSVEMYKASSAGLTPVKHTIKLEAAE